MESLSKPHDSTSIFKASPGKLDIKRHSPSFLYYEECILRYQVYQTRLRERILNHSASLNKRSQSLAW